MAIGEPSRFESDVVVVEGHRGAKIVKEEIEMWRLQGKTVVKPDQHRAAIEIAKFCRQHDLVSQILKDGTGERTLLWVDSETGAPCKARLDWVTKTNFITDWKTFDAVYDEDKLEYQIRTMGYQFQAAWYLEGFFRVYGKRSKGFINVFLRNDPVDCAVRAIAEQSIEETIPHIRHYLKDFAECLKTNNWPMLPPQLGEIVVKPFWS